MIKKIKSYLMLYFIFRSRELQKMMVNKFDFLIYIFCDLIIQLVGVVFFMALFYNIPLLKEWEFTEIVFIYSLFQFSYGLFGFLFWPLFDFDYTLISGNFDIILMRPLSSVFQLICKGMGDIGGVLIGIIGLTYSIINKVFIPTPVNLLLLGLFVACNLIIYICLYIMIASTSFWFPNISGKFTEIFNLGTNFARYPLNIFSKTVRMILTWIVPLGYIGFYPASFFLQNKWKNQILFLPVVVGVLVVITITIWKNGIRQYWSTGN